jgi:hypothetical protein
VANHDTLFVNIYAPSGNSKRQERDAFYNTELILFIKPNAATLLPLVEATVCHLPTSAQTTVSSTLDALIRRYNTTIV